MSIIGPKDILTEPLANLQRKISDFAIENNPNSFGEIKQSKVQEKEKSPDNELSIISPRISTNATSIQRQTTMGVLNSLSSNCIQVPPVQRYRRSFQLNEPLLLKDQRQRKSVPLSQLTGDDICKCRFNAIKKLRFDKNVEIILVDNWKKYNSSSYRKPSIGCQCIIF